MPRIAREGENAGVIRTANIGTMYLFVWFMPGAEGAGQVFEHRRASPVKARHG